MFRYLVTEVLRTPRAGGMLDGDSERMRDGNAVDVSMESAGALSPVRGSARTTSPTKLKRHCAWFLA